MVYAVTVAVKADIIRLYFTDYGTASDVMQSILTADNYKDVSMALSVVEDWTVK